MSLVPVPAANAGAGGAAYAPPDRAGYAPADAGFALAQPARSPGCSGTRGSSRPPAAGPALVLVGHGSRDPRSAGAIRALAELVAPRWTGTVTAAFLDFDAPTVSGALRALGAVDAAPIVVPALLTRAYHGRVDLPEVLGSIPTVTRIAGVLGPAAPGEPVDARLVAALLRRVSELDVRFDGLALLAAGTSHPQARRTVQEVAAVLGDVVGVPSAVGYASAAEPGPAEAVAALHARGCRRVLAGAYFLAPGRLYNTAVQRALAAGARGIAEPLGTAPELVDLIVARATAVLPTS